MQANSEYTLLYPAQVDWEALGKVPADVPFSDAVIEYLNALSAALLHDRTSRAYPDVVTFAFFCRKANLLKLKETYVHGELRLGRGTLFHIAPSNVPINFGYSLVAGLLAGNVNIVRVSSKDFPQVSLVVRHLTALWEEGRYDDVARRIALVRYDRTSAATAFFSSICQARVIWGGDATIAYIRQYPIPSRAFDVCFADRYSIAVIHPQAVFSASDEEMQRLAEAFYNDTYLFDQNACSAPHTVFWLRQEWLDEAKDRFWKAVHECVARRYILQPVMAVDKLTAFYRQAVALDVQREAMPDNSIVRTDLRTLTPEIESYRCACGYFTECTVEALDELAEVVNLKYQTLGYYGLESSVLQDFIRRKRLKGLDRIVPIGETTSFSLTWDGYNLIDTLSRAVSVL